MLATTQTTPTLKSVLVVDDEALIVMLTASWLEDHGCEVETALNGTEALTPNSAMNRTSRC